MLNGRFAVVFAVIAVEAGCGLVPQESVKFQPTPRQEIVSQDGYDVVVSRAKNSVVTMRSAHPQFTFDSRPAFIVGIQNLSQRPLEFSISNVSATEIVNGRETERLKVYSDKELVSDEKNRKFGRELFASMMAGVSDGLGNDPSNGNAISDRAAQVHAERMNEIQEIALVDHVLEPKGTYAGKLEIDKPSSINSGARRYSIAMRVGLDLHEIQIAQVQLPVPPIIQFGAPVIVAVPDQSFGLSVTTTSQ